MQNRDSSTIVPMSRRSNAPRAHEARFIVVEGVHGAGKSTLCELLQKRFSAALLHATPEFVRFRAEAQLDQKVAWLPRLFYYMAVTMQVSDLVREQLTRRHVVCDRYIATPLSLMACDGSLDAEAVAEFSGVYESYCCRPDFTLLLTVDYDVAVARIKQRSAHVASWTEKAVLDSPAFFDRAQEEFRREVARRGPFMEVNTSKLECQDVLSVVLPVIENQLGLPVG